MKYLITGVNGQDGFFAARHFLKKGHEVFGVYRRKELEFSPQLRFLKTWPLFKPVHISSYEEEIVSALIGSVIPDRVVHGAGFRDIPGNADESAQCFFTNVTLVEFLLKALKKKSPQCHFLFLSSGEIFDRAQKGALHELSRRAPQNDYGTTKVYGMELINSFRQSGNCFATSAICFNHDSVWSPPDHLVRLVPKKLLRLKKKPEEMANFFNVGMKRDFSHASDFVRAFDLMLENRVPNDYVVASGTPTELKVFIALCCGLIGLDPNHSVIWKENPQMQTYDRIADPSKIKRELMWQPRYSLQKLCREMIYWEKKRMQADK